MLMSSDQAKGFEEWLIEKNVSMTCQACGQQRLVQSDQIFFLSKEEREAPFFVLGCLNCSNVHFFGAKLMGLAPVE